MGGEAIYTEMRDWVVNRIREDIDSHSQLIRLMDTGPTTLPNIGFGRQNGNTWAALRVIGELHNQHPPILYCVSQHEYVTNLLERMMSIGVITQQCGDIIESNVCTPSTLMRTVHTSILPPALIMIDRSVDIYWTAFRGSRLESPMVLVG